MPDQFISFRWRTEASKVDFNILSHVTPSSTSFGKLCSEAKDDLIAFVHKIVDFCCELLEIVPLFSFLCDGILLLSDIDPLQLFLECRHLSFYSFQSPLPGFVNLLHF